MAVSGKKINELEAITNLTDNSVLPIVIVTNNNPESVAKKVTVKQISDNVLPDQTDQNGKVLTTDGTNVSWQTPQGTTYTAGTGIKIESNQISAEAVVIRDYTV